MRIAHLPSSYLPESVGGTEVYVHSLCLELATAGHQVMVAIHARSSDGSTEQEQVTRLPSLSPSHRVNLYSKTNRSRPPGFDGFLTTWQPDIVHFHALTLGAGPDHAAACRAHSIPYIVTYHTPAMSCPRGTLLLNGVEPCDGRVEPQRCSSCCLQSRGYSRGLAQILSLSPIPSHWLPDTPLTQRLALPSLLRLAQRGWEELFHGASHIIACAEFCADVLSANGVPKSKITVQRQGLAGDDRIRTLRIPLHASENCPLRIGYFGRMNVTKGADLLPPLLRRLQAEGIEATGEWVGPLDGDEAWLGRLWADGEGVARYAGVLRGDELTEWISSQDLIVLPSRWLETGPLTLLEAWDCGTPVIGTDRAGIRDFMNAAGLQSCLHAPDDIESMASAVRRLLTWKDPPPQVRVAGLRQIAERVVEVYKTALA